MTKRRGPAKAAGGIEGTGSTLVVEAHVRQQLHVDAFRFKNADVKMARGGGRLRTGGPDKYRAGAFIIRTRTWPS
jgi:hypothetical protein